MRNHDFPKLDMRRPPSLAKSGGAVRLGRPHRGVLGVAEGWETAAAARQLAGIACWATTGWALLETWEPPPEVHTVIVWADHDASGRGQRSAETLASRLMERGRAVHIAVPPQPDSDWCDVALAWAERGGRWCPPMVAPGLWTPPFWRPVS